MATKVAASACICTGPAPRGRMIRAALVMLPPVGLSQRTGHLQAPALATSEVAPLPTARSSAESPLREILTEFAVEEDAVSKVQLLVKYAHMLPHMSESDQTAANRVMGCTTQVWISANLDVAGTVQLAAKSEAILPRGFTSVLVHALSGTCPETLLEMDLVALFSELCLHAASLTPSRTNGFLNILDAVRKRVSMLVTAPPSCPPRVITYHSLAPQAALPQSEAAARSASHAPALYLQRKQGAVQEVAAQLEASHMAVVSPLHQDPEVCPRFSRPALKEARSLLAILDEAGCRLKVLRMDPDAITWSPREKSTYPGDLKRAFVMQPGLQVLQHAANTSLRSPAQVSGRQPPSASQLDLPSLGDRLRGDFPILHQNVNGRPLVYLDSGATSQKPTQVLRAMDEYYNEINSNVHRSVHHLSAQATTAYETARQKVASFIRADSWREVVFTRNASEAVNLVAHAWGTANLRQGDEIIVSVAEHHSVIVPMQMLAQRTGAELRHVGLTPDQRVDTEALKAMLGPRTRLVATLHVSNVLGSITDVADLSRAVHAVGGKLLVDACQSVPNMPIDVQQLGADWLVASSHKMCGPTGIGFLWGRYDVLDSMVPWMGGGEMIQDVFLNHSTYADPPGRFEAGTPAIAEAIGLGAACEYLTSLGMENVAAYEQQLGTYLYEQLSVLDGVDIYGPPPSVGRAALCSFNVNGLHAIDVSTVLDQAGVALRSGHHCTQPLHRALGINASARASLYLYNTSEDVDRFIEVLRDSVSFFRKLGL